jgi:hypothetical protein
MRKLSLLNMLCLFWVTACSTSESPYGQAGASVERVALKSSEFFIFHYKPEKVYGLASGRRDAVVLYLGRNQQALPPKCANGIEILEIVDGENGESAASFKCNPPVIRRS